MITATEINEIIRTSKKRTLRFDDTIVGQVIIPAGTYARAFEFDQILGGLVVGGYNLPGCKLGSFREADHKIENRGNPDLIEYGGAWLQPKVKGDRPIAEGLKINANINALGGRAAFYGTALHKCHLAIHAANATHHGVMLDKCHSTYLRGSAVGIGVAGKTGQGYACQIKAGFLCSVNHWHVQGARSGVQLSHGGNANFVRGLSGELWPGGIWADIHGGNEQHPFFDVPEVKIGNEAWTGEPYSVQFGPSVRRVIAIEVRPGVTLGVPVEVPIEVAGA